MATAIKKTADDNGIYQYVEAINASDYPSIDWEYDPNISGVSGVSRNYWKYDGTNTVVEMSQGEKDVVDAAITQAIALTSDPVVYLHIDEQTYVGEEEKIITLPFEIPNMVVHLTDPNVTESVGASLVSPKGTGWDPGGVSNNIANINNGVYTDLVYNNVVPGNTEGIIFGIDMGSAITINSMKKWDYSTSYYDKHWEFIGTNNSDGTGYTVIFEVEQNSANVNEPYERSFSDQTFRYFGCRCSESFNATYTIMKELELYEGGTVLTVEKLLDFSTEYSYMITSPTEIYVKNLSTETRTLKVVATGK